MTTATTTPYVLDPLGADVRAEAEALRARGPVTPVLLPGGVPAWAITTAEAIQALLIDDRVSKDPRAHWPRWADLEAGRMPEASWMLSWIGPRNMFNAAGADHRRLRRLVAPAFAPRRVQAMTATIAQTCATLLDDIEGRGLDQPGVAIDLVAEFAHPLPMTVICDLMGVPREDRDEARRLIGAVMDTSLPPEESAAVFAQIPQFLASLVEAKRDRPQDDLTSVLIAERDEDGSRLSEEELIWTLLLVIGAGFETTVNLIGSAVQALLTHPEANEFWRGGAVSAGDVVEETLRWAPSIAMMPLRYATEDITLHGTTIPAGDAILPAFLAANTDPALYGPTGGQFDPSRPATRHLAFGHGPHLCLGAALARLEGAIALRGLRRWPHMTLAGPPTPRRSCIAHGPAKLPVILTP